MYVPSMFDSNLEIRIVGSCGCLQLSFNLKNSINVSFLTGWRKASTTSAHKEGWHITGWYRSHVDKSFCWCITSHTWTPSASTLYTSYQYTWFPSISSYCSPSVAWEACGSWCKQSWWRQTGLCWSQPQDHLGLTIHAKHALEVLMLSHDIITCSHCITDSLPYAVKSSKKTHFSGVQSL